MVDQVLNDLISQYQDAQQKRTAIWAERKMENKQWQTNRKRKRGLVRELLLNNKDYLEEWDRIEPWWEKWIRYKYRSFKSYTYKNEKTEAHAFKTAYLQTKAKKQPLEMAIWVSIERGWRGIFPARNPIDQQLFYESTGLSPREQYDLEVVVNRLDPLELYLWDDEVYSIALDFTQQNPVLLGAFHTGYFEDHLFEMAMVTRKVFPEPKDHLTPEDWQLFRQRKGRFAKWPGDRWQYPNELLRIAAKRRLYFLNNPDAYPLTLIGFAEKWLQI